MNREKFLYLKALRGLPKPKAFNENQICFEYIDSKPEVKLDNGIDRIEYHFFFEKNSFSENG